MAIFTKMFKKAIAKPVAKISDKTLNLLMPSIQRDKDVKALIPQMQAAADESKKANEDRYNQILTAYGGDVMPTATQTSTPLAPPAGGYAAMANPPTTPLTTTPSTPLSPSVIAPTAPLPTGTGYQQTASFPAGGIIGGYGAREANVSQLLNNVAAGYGARENNLTGLLDNMGSQSRADIGNQYAAQRASAAQDLTSRGLGNSTVQSSVMAGLGEKESAEKRRFDEAMRQQQFGYRRDLSGDTLAARQAAATGYGNVSANTLGARENALQVVQNRNDIGPGLNDIATLTQSLGQDGLMKLIAQIAGGYATGYGNSGGRILG